MVREPLPRGLKKAIERLEAEPERPWRLCDLAALCGVSPRTLQKHFRLFLGSTPRTFLRELRFDRARQGLLAGCDEALVTGIATRCGFDHLGRFAAEYRRRYGGARFDNAAPSPARSVLRLKGPLPVFISSLDRPAVALPRFDHIGPPIRIWRTRLPMRLPWRCSALAGSGRGTVACALSAPRQRPRTCIAYASQSG